MKRTLTAILLVVTLFTVTTVPSCTKDGDPTGPALFVAAVIILGITVGGWFDDGHDDSFPPDTYDRLPYYGERQFHGAITGNNDEDWYRTEVLRPGDRFRVRSESDIGVRAVLVDEMGMYYSSDNYGPGSNFRIEIRASETTSYYLMVTGHENGHTGPYTIYWDYAY